MTVPNRDKSPGETEDVPSLKVVLWRSQVQQARAALDALESYAIGRGDDEGARSFAKCIRKVLVELLAQPPENIPQQSARGREGEDSDAALLGKAWGALNFIMAFYQPGQSYLDTEAWKNAEAGGKLAHDALSERLGNSPGWWRRK